MTELRKKLQDKLRKKFRYETNTNRNRGTSLIKPNACIAHYSINSEEYDLVTDMAIVMDHWDFRLAKEHAIRLYLTHYKTQKSTDKFDKLADLSATISFEELEMLYQIACEMRKETEELFNVRR